MSGFAGTAFVRVEGDFSRLNRQLAAQVRPVSKLGSAIGAGLRTGILAGGAAAATGAKQFADFQLQMQRLRSEAGATQQEVNRMTKAVLELTKSGKTKFSANEISQGLFYLESHAFRGAKGLKLLKDSMDLATAGNADLVSTTRALSAVMKSGIAPFKDARKVAGQLNAAVGQGSLRMQDLINALGTGVVPAARTFHLKLNDVTSALAVLTRTGATAQLSATRLRYAFALLGAPSQKAADVFKTMGLKQDALAKDMRKPHGLLVALEDLHKHLDTLPGGANGVAASQALSRAFGGARSFATISALLQNLDALGGIYKKTDQRAADFNAEVKSMNDSVANRFHRAISALNSDLIELGQKVAPFATKELDDLFKIINDPRLSTGQKFSKVASGINKGITDAEPVIVHTVETIAPKIGLALVKGFWNSSEATRFLTGAFLVQRLVGWGNIFRSVSGRVGGTAGTVMGEEMNASMKVQLQAIAIQTEALITAIESQVAGVGAAGPLLARSAKTGRFVGYVNPVGGNGAGPAVVAGGLGAAAARSEIESLGQTLERERPSLLRRIGTRLKGFGAGMGVTLGLGAAITFGPELVKHGIRGLSSSSSTFGLPKNPRVLSSKTLGNLVPTAQNLPSVSHPLSIFSSALRVGTFGLLGGNGLNKGEQALKRFGDTAEATFKKAEKTHDYRALKQLQQQAASLADSAEKLGHADWAKKLREFGAAAGEAQQPFHVLVNNIGLLKNHAEATLKDTVALFRSNSAQIPQVMDMNTMKADRLVSRNLGATVSQIKALLHDGVIGTKSAMNAIHQVFVNTLVTDYGFDPKAAKTYSILKHARGGIVKAARGYMIGQPGEAGADTVPLMLPPGTAVLNRHQLAALGLASGGAVPTVVGRGEMVVPPGSVPGFDSLARARGFGGLGGLFSQITRPNYLASGGLAGVKPGMASFARAFLKRFPLSVTSTTGGGHAAHSYHYLGEAVDFGGAPEVMNAAAAWLKSSGTYHKLTEGIHNPNLSVKFGKLVSPGYWGAKTWGQHLNHIHVAIAGALAGALGSSLGIKVRAGGRPSMFRSVRQAVANRTVGAANRALAGVSGPDTGALGAGAYGKAALKSLWTRAGGPAGMANLMAAIALAESGGNPDAFNPSGATGLWQILGALVPGNLKNPIVNARNAVAKWKTQGLGAWVTYTNGAFRQFLGRGGFVQRFAGGGRTKPRVARSAKLPKRKKGHTKAVHEVHTPKGPVSFAPELAPPNVQIKRINKILGDTGTVAYWGDLYDTKSNIYDLNDFTYVVTTDPTTGQSIAPHIDWDAVNARVGELNELAGYQNNILGQLRLANTYLEQVIPQLQAQVKARTRAIQKLRTRIKTNLKRIKALKQRLNNLGSGETDHKTIASLRQQISDEEAKKKPSKARLKALRDRIAAIEEAGRNNRDSISKQRKSIQAEISRLEAQNKHWGGSTTSIGSGGAIGTLLHQRQSFQDALSNVRADQLTVNGPSGQGGEIASTNLTLAQLSQQLSQLGAPALQVQLNQATPPGLDSSVLAGLLQQKLDEVTQDFKVSQAQYSVLAGLPLVGSFAGGGIVPGRLGEPGLAVVHGKERIIDPRVAGDSALVHVLLEDHRTRVMVNGIEQEVTRVTNKQAALAARRLPGAGGGLLRS